MAYYVVLPNFKLFLSKIDNVAVSFEIMVNEYVSSKEAYYGRSPFSFGDYLQSSFSLGIGRLGASSTERQLGQFIDDVRKSFEVLRKAVRMLSLGFDYRKYARFLLLTPHVMRAVSGDYNVSRKNWGEKGLPTIDDVQFCIDFVIESAIKLEEFDFVV